MKYRHTFHAGNFADIHKHVTLLALLKCLFEHYGGWVGTDDNTFETIYDVNNIDSLSGPFHK